MELEGIVGRTMTPREADSAFTLVEMIGVLAIIAILVGALVPRVFESMNKSAVSSVAQSVRGLKAGLWKYHFRNAEFPAGDMALVEQGMIDQLISVSIGADNAGDGFLRLLVATDEDLAIAADGITGANFDLSGDGGATQETPSGANLVVLEIDGVDEINAVALNELIDGASLSDASDSAPNDGADEFGAVIYDGSGGFPVTVYVYLAHR